jgi:hypothetical protein
LARQSRERERQLPFTRATGVLMMAIGVLAIWFPRLLAGLRAATMPRM